MEGPQNISLFPNLYLTCNILLALLVFLKSLDPYLLTYTFSQTFLELSLWRPITAIFYLGRIGLILPFQLVFAYLAASKLANRVYQREGAADLAWLMVLSIILLMIFSTFISLYFYGNSFVMIMLMMWAMNYPTDTIQLFGAQIHSIYVPIIYPALMIALGSGYKNYMAGFLLGLLLGAIKNPNYIRDHGDIFPTPNLIKSFFRYDAYEIERMRIESVRNSQRDNSFQGRGYRLN